MTEMGTGWTWWSLRIVDFDFDYIMDADFKMADSTSAFHLMLGCASVAKASCSSTFGFACFTCPKTVNQFLDPSEGGTKSLGIKNLRFLEIGRC